MRYCVDIDGTICTPTVGRGYEKAQPWNDRISTINKLYDDGWNVIYWTARGSMSGIDFKEFTINQLNEWNCKYHDIITGTDSNPKPFYDMIIDDKAKRIEEL